MAQESSVMPARKQEAANVSSNNGVANGQSKHSISARTTCLTAWLLMGPACLFLILCFVVPVGYVLVLSITDPTLSLDNYERFASVPLYRNVLLNTFKVSLVVTVLCLLIGYPIAYVMAQRSDALSIILMGCVAMSFWIGFVPRTYSWFVILGNRGPIATFYRWLEIGEPPQLLFTSFSSMLGITHIMLPFMVLSLYGVMKGIDPRYVKAAASLGARPAISFWHVYLPLSLPGVVNGVVLVFTISLGFYITPILLGTPRDMMISQLISQQIEDLLAWGFAATIAVVLLLVTLAVLAVFNRVAGLDRLWH